MARSKRGQDFHSVSNRERIQARLLTFGCINVRTFQGIELTPGDGLITSLSLPWGFMDLRTEYIIGPFLNEEI